MDQATVLCVDDDPDLVALTASLLEGSNERFETITETNPRAVIDRLAEQSVDCVVSDYDMPEMNGITLLESVRERYPALPFILFTGKGSEEVASTAIAHGVTDYLQKATGEEVYELLANRVANAVAQYRASQRANDLGRIRGLLGAVNQMLVRTTERGLVERRICEILTDAEPYLLACMLGAESADARREEPAETRLGVGDSADVDTAVRAVATDSTVTDTSDRECLDSAIEGCPIGDAVESGSIATRGNPALELPVDRIAEGSVSSAAVPIQYDGHRWGVLCLVAERVDAFDRRERNLIAEISEDLGHAIYRIELQERQQRFERIISNLPVGVYRNAPLPDGTLLEVNPRLVELFDADSEDDLVGRPFRDLYADPADREQFVSKLERTGIVRDMELDLETLSGEQFEASVTGLMTTEGEERYFDGIVQDLSERRAQRPVESAFSP